MCSRSPVFVVGCPRSGTTLLYHQLLSSGGFAIYRTEVKAYSYLAPLAGHFRSRPKRQHLLDRWMRSEDFLRSGLESEQFGERVLEECRSTGDFQRILMTSICESQGAARWADCTPENALHIEAIRRDFPDARFIHMVRDGRDVALSLARQGWIRPFRWDAKRPVVPAAVYWDWIVERGHDAGRRIAGQYLEVHYRELVQRPQETLAAVGEFLGHEIDFDLVQRVGIGSVSRPNTSFPAEADANRFGPVDRWKRDLDENELRLVEALIGLRLTRLGYRLASNTVSPPQDFGPRLHRWLYRTNFGARVWLKNLPSLSWLATDHLLTAPDAPMDEADRTLRPGAHLDHVRRIVGRQPQH